MKNVVNVIKGLVFGMVLVVGCLVNSNVAQADINDPNIINHYIDNKGNIITEYKYGSYYINSDVEIQSKNCIDNTVTINKDGQLYSFYVDNAEEYYLGEQINITMDNNNKIVDCIVDSEPIVYNNVSVIYADNEVCCIRIDNNVYDFKNEDSSYKANDSVNVVIQNDEILEVKPCVNK